jgi:hypothetical protein
LSPALLELDHESSVSKFRNITVHLQRHVARMPPRESRTSPVGIATPHPRRASRARSRTSPTKRRCEIE